MNNNHTTSSSYEDLRRIVLERTIFHFEPAGVPADLIPKFADIFTAEIDAILLKFADGQREHGGDIRDRDVRRERRNEIRDLIVYDLTEVLQETCIRIRI